jgi:hypothetical protein
VLNIAKHAALAAAAAGIGLATMTDTPRAAACFVPVYSCAGAAFGVYRRVIHQPVYGYRPTHGYAYVVPRYRVYHPAAFRIAYLVPRYRIYRPVAFRVARTVVPVYGCSGSAFGMYRAVIHRIQRPVYGCAYRPTYGYAYAVPRYRIYRPVAFRIVRPVVFCAIPHHWYRSQAAHGTYRRGAVASAGIGKSNANAFAPPYRSVFAYK